MKVGICGIGQMGASAVALFRRAGFPVLVWARNREKLDRLDSEVTRMLDFLDQHFDRPTCALGTVEASADLSDVRDQADFVLECIAENIDQKVEFLRQLRPAAERGAIITTCTSGLSINELGQRAGIGPRFLGAHFWNPPHLMPVVEVVCSDETVDGLSQRVSNLLRSIGKIPIPCKDVPGFIGNRLIHAIFREAVHLVESGVCTAEDVDRVARLTFALRMPAVGPCENMDLVGFGLVADIQSYLLQDLSNARGVMPLVQQKLAAGDTGMRGGRGFYDWTKRDPQQLIEQRDLQIIRQLQFLYSIGRVT